MSAIVVVITKFLNFTIKYKIAHSLVSFISGRYADSAGGACAALRLSGCGSTARWY